MVRHYACMCVHRPNWKFSTKTEKKNCPIQNPNLEHFKERGTQEERGRDLLSMGFRTWKGHVCLQSVFTVNAHLEEAMHLRICCL